MKHVNNKNKLVIYISLTHKNANRIPMFRQLLNSLFLYSNPNKFHILLLLDQDTVTPVMRVKEIDPFSYTVAMSGAEEQLDLLMTFKRVLMLPPNVLLQDDVMALVKMPLKASTVYTDASGAVRLCAPFRGMFESPRTNTATVEAMVSQVHAIKDCFRGKMFLLFMGSSEHKKFVARYFDRLMMNKCASA